MVFFHQLIKYLQRLRFFLMKGMRLPVCLSLIATLFTSWVFLDAPPGLKTVLNRLDNIVYDQRYAWMLPPKPEADFTIVIVDYDQKSLDAEGQWPWSRFVLGDLVTELSNYGVLVIGFDAFFPEHERNLVDELSQRLEPGDNLNAIVSQLEGSQSLLDGDQYFSQKMAATEVVMGFSFLDKETMKSGTLPEPIFTIDDDVSQTLIYDEVNGYIGNIDVLQEGAAGAGFFDTVPDPIDGIVRYSPLIMQFESKFYPSLALEMARVYYFEESFSLSTRASDTAGYNEIRGINMAQKLIPTDPVGRVHVPYVGPRDSYLYISATDVLHGNLSAVEKAALDNSLVLIGSTATGLYDLRSTPLDSVYPGVEVHANVLSAILRSTPATTIDAEVLNGAGFGGLMSSLDFSFTSPFPIKPYWEQSIIFFGILFLGAMLSLVFPRLGPTSLVLSSAGLMSVLVFINLRLWSEYHLDLSLVILLILVLLITIVNLTNGFLREGVNRRTIKGMFDQYVPPAHIDAMLENPDKYDFEGESKDLSVLFSDVRDFTSISEHLNASQVKSLLNNYLTPITGIIFEHQGTIDKYVGDMVVAFWGDPLDDPEHRNHAVSAALAMLEKVQALKPIFAAQGLPEISIGIGINSGHMNVGDMGSTYRRAYTVIGDAVNLGSRLESLTKYYGVELLIGEDTFKQLDSFLCRQVDRVLVKGKEEPILIYQPLCTLDKASQELITLVEEYHQAYTLYLKQDWDAAEAGFVQLKDKDSKTALYDIYLKRIKIMREDKPETGWDGTHRHTSK